MNKLFVYGTLKPGCSNHYILEQIGGNSIEAKLYGYQFDENWERKTGYPGLIKGDVNAEIEGFLFISENLTKSWSILDEFETEAYSRIIVPIAIENNTAVNGFVYIINLNFDIENF